jgi:hypothetical protein
LLKTTSTQNELAISIEDYGLKGRVDLPEKIIFELFFIS